MFISLLIEYRYLLFIKLAKFLRFEKYQFFELLFYPDTLTENTKPINYICERYSDGIKLSLESLSISIIPTPRLYRVYLPIRNPSSGVILL